MVPLTLDADCGVVWSWPLDIFIYNGIPVVPTNNKSRNITTTNTNAFAGMIIFIMETV